MRFLVGILASVMRTGRQRRNLRLLGWLVLVFLGLLTAEATGLLDAGYRVMVGPLDDPDALEPLPAESELVLVGDGEAETRFIERFGRAAPAG